jgi:hypothetical protein
MRRHACARSAMRPPTSASESLTGCARTAAAIKLVRRADTARRVAQPSKDRRDLLPFSGARHAHLAGRDEAERRHVVEVLVNELLAHVREIAVLGRDRAKALDESRGIEQELALA